MECAAKGSNVVPVISKANFTLQLPLGGVDFKSGGIPRSVCMGLRAIRGDDPTCWLWLEVLVVRCVEKGLNLHFKQTT